MTHCLYILFSLAGAGSAWTGDYGHPEDPDDFDFIYPISPIQNVPKGKVLPPYLLMTADREPLYIPRVLV